MNVAIKVLGEACLLPNCMKHKNIITYVKDICIEDSCRRTLITPDPTCHAPNNLRKKSCFGKFPVFQSNYGGVKMLRGEGWIHR